MPMETGWQLFDGSAIPKRILRGPGCRKALPDQLELLEFERILIVTGPTIRTATRFVDELMDDLGERAAGVFDQVQGHTPVTSMEAPAALARELNADAVLSLGGGSVHDAAKAIAVMAPSQRSVVDFVSRFEPPDIFHSPDVDVTPLPVVTIPSTMSAADVVGGGAVTDTATGEKLIFVHPKLTPALVVLDGEVLASTPGEVLGMSGMNALHHCLEALYSRGHQPITDAFALRAIQELVAVLPALAPGAPTPNIATFQRALDASSMSGLTYANSWLGIGHAVCHSLGGRYGLSHGKANSVMVRNSLRFNLKAAEDRLALAARAIGVMADADRPELAAEQVVAVVDDLANRLQVPWNLRELGLPEGQFETIADDVMADPQTYWNPRPVAREDVIELLEQAW